MRWCLTLADGPCTGDHLHAEAPTPPDRIDVEHDDFPGVTFSYDRTVTMVLDGNPKAIYTYREEEP